MVGWLIKENWCQELGLRTSCFNDAFFSIMPIFYRNAYKNTGQCFVRIWSQLHLLRPYDDGHGYSTAISIIRQSL